jgi:hypothetical protein
MFERNRGVSPHPDADLDSNLEANESGEFSTRSDDDDDPRARRLKRIALVALVVFVAGAWLDYLIVGDRFPFLREGESQLVDARVDERPGADTSSSGELTSIEFVPLPTPGITWFAPRPAAADDAEPAATAVPTEAPQAVATAIPETPSAPRLTEGQLDTTASRDDSEPDSAFPRVEPEIRHVAAPFRTFWQRNGGLMVFGYPLTVAFETSEGRTVQYFERQRFETHPENDDTPYDVLLGHVGIDDATQRGLITMHPFRPQVQGSTAPGDECSFFPETGHWVCDEFLEYWHAHGLDLGDASITFRESLALFGYPISEVFTDPDSGLQTQYFERARFELHPDNPEEFRVLLGRLGAERVELNAPE